MNNTNPLYVPRNYLAQLAIDAEQGDFAKVEEWMQVLEQPYTRAGNGALRLKRPEWAQPGVHSCLAVPGITGAAVGVWVRTFP